MCRKMLEVKIIDDEEYEKNKTFTIQLGEPILLEIGQKHGEEKLSFNLFYNLSKREIREITGYLSSAATQNELDYNFKNCYLK